MQEVPAEGPSLPPLSDPVGRLLDAAARGAAMFGGGLLTAIMVMVIVSIAGRALLGLGRAIPFFADFGPVPGDFEIVEMGGAIAVAAFMPLCQMRQGHVLVDIFFRNSGERSLALFSAISNLLFALAASLLVWQMILGLFERQSYGETTMILLMPVWWGFAGVSVFFVLAVACGLYMAFAYLRLASTGRARA